MSEWVLFFGTLPVIAKFDGDEADIDHIREAVYTGKLDVSLWDLRECPPTTEEALYYHQLHTEQAAIMRERGAITSSGQP